MRILPSAIGSLGIYEQELSEDLYDEVEKSIQKSEVGFYVWCILAG